MKAGRIEIPFGAQNCVIETGKFAKQANAAVTISVGGTVVLVTACMAKTTREDIDFFPLMVEYQEKTYSAGRIPGGFFKREGRPSQEEILSSRIIDRSIRPMFPKGFLNEVQVVATVLSSDGENDPDILALIGASTALHISDILFDGPLAAVRIGLVDNQFVVNPNYVQREASTMDLVVVGFGNKIVMIEGEIKDIPEAKVTEALHFAVEQFGPMNKLQEDFRRQVGKEKTKVALITQHPDLKNKLVELTKGKLTQVYRIADKLQRENARQELLNGLLADLTIYEAYKMDGREVKASDIKAIFDEIEYDEVRRMIFEENKRADGRGAKDIRELSCEVEVLPRTHGSALFTRGQTQSLAVVTLGTKRDEQLVEALEGVSYNAFMLHYNFPSFSVGETKPMRSPGRREIGHGALAAKAIKNLLPTKEAFPYTIRVVSEILESNGSSSMASVCAGCLSLMDAGVPMKSPVAGISVGLVTEENRYALLTDIMGLEDHFGDMDFKVAGTRDGVTAIQLDIKIQGVPVNILDEGIKQGREARFQILDVMKSAIAQPKTDISQFAPRIVTTQVPVDKIGEVIGPGGKMIKKIIEQTGVESIDIEDDGTVLIASLTKEAADQALAFVNGMVQMPEIGKIYDAVVEKVTNFGAFCEFLPGRSGLVHVSEFSDTFIKDLTNVVKVGDRFKVKLVEIDQMKRMNLSKKQAEAKS